MNYLNKAILNKYKNHWYTLRDAGFISNLTRSQVEELESVYKAEIDANYTVNKWCMSCVAEMVRILYLATKFDTQVEEKENPTAYQTISDPVADFLSTEIGIGTPESFIVKDINIDGNIIIDGDISLGTNKPNTKLTTEQPPKKRGRKKRK